MLRKYRALIITVPAVVLSVAVILTVCYFRSNQTLSKSVKEKIAYAFCDYAGIDRQYVSQNVIWYDENGGKEENRVFRYIGTYGDCIALLIIGDNQNATFEPVELPYPIQGLSRSVYYHAEASVYLYNTKTAVNIGGLKNQHLLWLGETGEYNWLTDAQLERLTRDIEIIAKSHK